MPSLADRHAFDVATEDAEHGELVAAGARFIVRAELTAAPCGVVGRIRLLHWEAHPMRTRAVLIFVSVLGFAGLVLADRPINVRAVEPIGEARVLVALDVAGDE